MLGLCRVTGLDPIVTAQVPAVVQAELGVLGLLRGLWFPPFLAHTQQPAAAVPAAMRLPPVASAQLLSLLWSPVCSCLVCCCGAPHAARWPCMLCMRFSGLPPLLLVLPRGVQPPKDVQCMPASGTCQASC